MILGDALQEIAYRFWAGRFGCDPADFARSGVLVFEDDGIENPRRFYLYRAGDLSVLRIAPSSIEALGFQRRVEIDLLRLAQ